MKSSRAWRLNTSYSSSANQLRITAPLTVTRGEPNIDTRYSETEHSSNETDIENHVHSSDELSIIIDTLKLSHFKYAD